MVSGVVSFGGLDLFQISKTHVGRATSPQRLPGGY